MKGLKLFFVLVIAAGLFIIGCSKSDVTTESKNILKAKVTLVMGSAYVLRENEPSKIALKMGDILKPSDVVITGNDGSVNIIIANTGVLKIKRNSNVSLKDLLVQKEGATARLSVSAGRVILGLKKLQKKSSFEVETPTAVAGVRGTTFMVSVENEDSHAFPYFVNVNKKKKLVTKIAVLTGKVELINPNNSKQSYMITTLKEATLNNDDFKNVKIEKITRLSINEIESIKEFSEIKELKLKEIQEEIQEVAPEVESEMNADIKSKAAIKSQSEDLSKTEKMLEEQKIEAKKKAIKTMKSDKSKKSEGKYLEDEEGGF